MTVGTSISSLRAGLVLLRWCEDPKAPVHEELVEWVGEHRSEPMVRSASAITELTRVYLIERQYVRSGIVKSCQPQEGSFILTIDISDVSVLTIPSERDPGIFAVEHFITEEQEAEILRELEENTA